MKPKKINILAIDDNHGDFLLIKKTLNQSNLNFDVVCKQSLSQGIGHIKNNPVDLILLDLALPDSTGINTLKTIITLNTDCTIIVLTGNANEQLGVDAMKIGAHDFLIKNNLETGSLTEAIRYALERKESDKEMKKHQLILEQEVEKRTRELTDANRKLRKEIETRKSIEKNLAASEENFRLISFSAKDAIVKMDSHGKIAFWNPAATQIFGYTEGEMIGKDAHTFLVPPNSRETAGHGVAEFLKTGKGKIIGETLELDAMHKNGSIIPIEISVSVLKIPPHAYQAVGIIRDISARKKAHNQVYESNLLLQTLINTIPAPIFYKDKKGLYLGANQAYYHFTKKKPEEIIGKTINQVLGNDNIYLDTYQALDAELLANGGKQVYESKIVNSKQETRDVIFHKAAFRNGNGEIAGIVSMFIDITENKKVTTELRELKHNLEKEIQTQTKELRDANATKDRFFSIIAHDLKSPFNVIQGFLTLIHEEFDEFTKEEVKEFIGKTLESAMNTFSLLENLLQWSRSQRGIIEFRPKNIQLWEMGIELLHQYSDNAQQKKVSIQMNMNENHVAFADPDMIRTILRNLLTNAIKFSHPDGEIIIDSTMQNNMLVVQVKDDGIGMDEQFRHNLFKIHKKTQRPGTMKEKGTGLGLIICKEFVEKNKGNIWVDSKENLGSSFYFSLPASILQSSPTH